MWSHSRTLAVTRHLIDPQERSSCHITTFASGALEKDTCMQISRNKLSLGKLTALPLGEHHPLNCHSSQMPLSKEERSTRYFLGEARLRSNVSEATERNMKSPRLSCSGLVESVLPRVVSPDGLGSRHLFTGRLLACLLP